MFEGTYSPPFYTDLYNFRDGAQNDIFVDSYSSIPPPSATQTLTPTPLSVSPSTTSTSVSVPIPSSSTPVIGSPTPNAGTWFVDEFFSLEWISDFPWLQ
jgi:hypothetical protein